MSAQSVVRCIAAGVVIAGASLLGAQTGSNLNDPRALIDQGNQALTDNRLHDAAVAFQRAIDLNPSSAKAHEQLGITLTREILRDAANASPDPDVSQRAEDNLKRAIELAPSATRSLMELSDLEALLPLHASDSAERSARYQNAQELLKQVLARDAGKPDVYLKLATLERDEFGLALQQAKAGAPANNPGPLTDVDLRHSLQQQYGAPIDDAIANAQKASENKPDAAQPLLLMSRLLQQRALIRNTLDEYTSDMHAADDWQRQFLSAGNHTAPAK